jgi:PPOX class probable F420-dependent enzyme
VRAIGLLPDLTEGEVPPSHLDLADCPPVAALSTIMASGYPQTSVVWCDVEGALLRVNTMRGFAKERNMRRDPRVTLLCYDPARPLRYLEVRGTVVEMTHDGAVAHLDALASKYMGRPARYFGDCIPAGFAETEIPVLCRIRPDRVVAMDGSASTTREATDDAPADPPGIATGDRVPEAPADAPDPLPIPASHLDLLERPICGVLTTMSAAGRPESSLVWVDHDGECARVNTTLERRKGRNLVANPRCSLLVVDPANTGRFVQIRGDAELVTGGALEHLDALTRAYTRHRAYYGHVYPVEQQARETRVICRIRARRITLDAIHA